MSPQDTICKPALDNLKFSSLTKLNHICLYFNYYWIAVVQWIASGTPTRTIRVRFPSDWLLHHGDNRGRHSANHNLLPEIHLHVLVLRVKTCRDSRLF